MTAKKVKPKEPKVEIEPELPLADPLAEEERNPTTIPMEGIPSLDNIFSTASEESERFSVLRTFFEERGIAMKTDLSTGEIKSIVVTELLTDILQSEFGLFMPLKEYTRNIKVHLVSRNRKGREEAMEVLRADSEKQKSLLQKLMGQGEN